MFDWLKSQRRRASSSGTYDKVVVDRSSYEINAYKQHLGGGAEGWERRGKFQLQLLQDAGLRPSHKLLDIGCGPLRAGKHFIEYLNAGHYVGVDYNQSFIETARRAVVDLCLSDRLPTLAIVRDFNLHGLNQRFDYAIAFSVLNHCPQQQQSFFFTNVSRALSPQATLIISHVTPQIERQIEHSDLEQVRRFMPRDLDLSSFGWTEEEQSNVCPILQLRPRAGPAVGAE